VSIQKPIVVLEKDEDDGSMYANPARVYGMLNGDGTLRRTLAAPNAPETIQAFYTKPIDELPLPGALHLSYDRATVHFEAFLALTDAEIAERMLALDVHWEDDRQLVLIGTATTDIDGVTALLNEMRVDAMTLMCPERTYTFARSQYGARLLNVTTQAPEAASEGVVNLQFNEISCITQEISATLAWPCRRQ
jgi:hypothetical protein